MEVNERSAASFSILNVPITASSFNGAIEEISHRVRDRRGTTLVHFTTVHMLVESVLSKEFAEMLRGADFNFPDGMPLVWLGRRAKKDTVARVCGPDFMPAFCKQTAHLGYRHFFYGGAPGTAEAVIATLQKETSDLEVAGTTALPSGR